MWGGPAPALLAGGAALAARLAGWTELALLLALLALGFALARQLPGAARWLALLLCSGLAAAWPGIGPEAAILLPPLLPSLGDLLLALHFGLTLGPGREALITRYTRADFGRLPPECLTYTRVLTGFWALLFLVLAPLHLALLLGLPPFPRMGAGLVMSSTAAVMLVLFLGEHAVRSLRFPQFGLATPARTLRAILRAHSTSDV